MTHLLGRRTFVEAALFRSDVSNSTQRFFVQPNVFQLRNLGEARFLGGEPGLGSALPGRLNFEANYTCLSRRNMTNPGLLMIDTPRHKIYSALAWQPAPRVSLVADLGYEGGASTRTTPAVSGGRAITPPPGSAAPSGFRGKPTCKPGCTTPSTGTISWWTGIRRRDGRSM
mgnify:CR=1 FL=1